MKERKIAAIEKKGNFSENKIFETKFPMSGIDMHSHVARYTEDFKDPF